MSEEAIDLDSLIREGKQNSKKSNKFEKRRGNNNNGNSQNNNQNNNNNNNKNNDNNGGDRQKSNKNNQGKSIFINRNKPKKYDDDEEENDSYRENHRKNSDLQDSPPHNQNDYRSKKIHKAISKNKDEDNDSQSHHPPRKLQVVQPAKKISLPKKLYVVKVKNLQSTFPPNYIYEFACQNDTSKVESISIQYNCAVDKKFIDTEIAFQCKEDATKFVDTYNQAELDKEELEIYFV